MMNSVVLKSDPALTITKLPLPGVAFVTYRSWLGIQAVWLKTWLRSEQQTSGICVPYNPRSLSPQNVLNWYSKLHVFFTVLFINKQPIQAIHKCSKQIYWENKLP